MDMRKLAIKMNNVATNDPCAICGERTDPALGPELFLADNWKLVCWECGYKYAPELVAILRFIQIWSTDRWQTPEVDTKGYQRRCNA